MSWSMLRRPLAMSVLYLLGSSAFAYTVPWDQHQANIAIKPAAATAAATAALSILLTTTDPAWAATATATASKTAAQVQLNSLPPTSVEVSIRDLPLVGDLLSGTYTKVPDGSIKNPSISIKSPKDKISAIKAAATAGHLEFDTDGILKTHLDIDVTAEEPGVAKVRVASLLIPKLPFKDPAAITPLKASGKESEWYSVTNLGNGETYYFSDKTGDSTFQRPVGY